MNNELDLCHAAALVYAAYSKAYTAYWEAYATYSKAGAARSKADAACPDRSRPQSPEVEP